MRSLILSLLLLMQHVDIIRSQVALADLTKIGIIPAYNYKLKIKGDFTNQLMVIRLYPNMTLLSNCSGLDTIKDDYQKMIARILLPINSSLTLMKNSISERVTGTRFWGAVIGGVALGVATSAQITAGIALHQSIKNSADIAQLKDAALRTNAAVEKLVLSGQKTAIAISALQEQINSQIIPTINELGCEVTKNTIRLKLNQYFSIITLIFGPNLRDPVSQSISIQALSQAFNGDFESITKELGYTSEDLLDILESESIRGRIIDVDISNMLITLQIEYPSMNEIPDAVLQEFNIISYNDAGEEWLSIFPDVVLKRGAYLSNFDTKYCTRTTKSYICSKDTSSPLSPTLYRCLTGELKNCARTRVVNSYVSRFALSQGVLFANCIPITCLCKSTDQSIIQDRKSTTLMISSEVCQEVYIDGIYIQVGKKYLNRTIFSGDIQLGQSISTDPIDISNEIADINKELDKAHNEISESNKILNKINPYLINNSSYAFIIIVCTILIIWVIVSVIWLIYLTKSLKSCENQKYQYNSTVNSLSSLIPGI